MKRVGRRKIWTEEFGRNFAQKRDGKNAVIVKFKLTIDGILDKIKFEKNDKI